MFCESSKQQLILKRFLGFQIWKSCFSKRLEVLIELLKSYSVSFQEILNRFSILKYYDCLAL